MAYQSDESGRWESYVRPFPNVNEGLWKVSNAGGIQPLWGSDQITVEIQHKLGANLLVSPLPSSLDIPWTGPPLRDPSSDSSLTSSPSPG